MTKRRKDTDYLFLSARIRAMERRLLTAQRLEQLLTAPSVEACAQLLSEWGYAPVHDEPSLQAALSAQREAVFADVSRFMPEAEVLDVFRLKYDYHNIKTLLKAPQDAERLLIAAGTVSAETMRKKHAENGGWDFLPADMAAAADEAQRVLAETGSARSSDCILDRAYFARLEKLAADSHIPYLQDYVRAMIDAANLRSLIRTQRLGLDAGFLREVLFPGGSVTPEAIRAGSGSGAAALWRGTAFAREAELGDEAAKGRCSGGGAPGKAAGAICIRSPLLGTGTACWASVRWGWTCSPPRIPTRGAERCTAWRRRTTPSFISPSSWRSS